MELFWVEEAQIQGNMSSSLSTGFEITDTGLHQFHYRPLAVTCFQIPVQLHLMPDSTGLMTRIFFGEKF